jgi:3-oxoadipate enol-lactonase
MSRTVVLVGSLGSTAAMWDPQRPALSDLRTIDVEHPGHGAAQVVDVPSVDALAERVLDAVDGPFSLVGLSLGGAVGMRLAADHPERVERLVLACATDRFGDPSQWLDRAAVVRGEGLGAIVDAVLCRWFTPAFTDVEPYRRMILSIDPEGYARCCEALAGWTGEGLERIEAPTLVVAGEHDPTVPPALAEELAGRIPGARLAVLDGAAHLANLERPNEFNRLLEEHLR